MTNATGLLEMKCAQRMQDEVDRRKLDFPDGVIGRYLVMLADRPVQAHHIVELRSRPGRAARHRASFTP